ncbi:uncharacterized protein OE_1593F [Halobacterium salinarum R1]|uniref:Uncharacterized protein n=3 Tax=Halobacterium salinarum TaxID=2242 RepID=A0A510N4L2_HALSA|nr:uncharacterized protein HBSAL_02505 [Halobacterium salinarum]CAP13215.1 uncharacterized protein OE_1593F [Halobacterium salinarum R1]DAC77649.1 TPA_inf: uncharacterized protein VNG_0401a [Halobacterium salinarum NRC-1]
MCAGPRGHGGNHSGIIGSSEMLFPAGRRPGRGNDVEEPACNLVDSQVIKVLANYVCDPTWRIAAAQRGMK